MFFRRSFFLVLFGLLLVFGLFGQRPRSDFSQGYAAGYAAAQQATGGEAAAATDATAEPAQAYPYRHGWGWGFFGIVGFFFKFWLMFAIFGIFMKMVGFGRLRHRHHGRWPGGHEKPYEKRPEDVEPDINHA